MPHEAEKTRSRLVPFWKWSFAERRLRGWLSAALLPFSSRRIFSKLDDAREVKLNSTVSLLFLRAWIRSYHFHSQVQTLVRPWQILLACIIGFSNAFLVFKGVFTCRLWMKDEYSKEWHNFRKQQPAIFPSYLPQSECQYLLIMKPSGLSLDHSPVLTFTSRKKIRTVLDIEAPQFDRIDLAHSFRSLAIVGHLFDLRADVARVCFSSRGEIYTSASKRNQS